MDCCADSGICGNLSAAACAGILYGKDERRREGPFFRILCGEERLAGYRDDRIKSCVPLLCGAEAVGGDRDRHVSAVF